jgi:DNA-binding HxlR family transcriptional regulator
MASSYASIDCPVARALDLIGERWSFLILRDLVRHPSRRFQDLADSLTGCAPNTLSARLKSLEEASLIERRAYQQNPPRMEYVLTAKGRGVRPVLRALKAWGTELQEMSDAG